MYDGDKLLCELDDDGTVTATLSWGAAGLFAYDGTQYQFDPQGSVVARVSAGDQVLSTHWYDAHGTEQTTPSTEPFGYKGQWGYYTDRETGLILCTHRYLDPEAGRWLTRDPIGFGGGVNLYGYCGNGAVQRADPAGLLWFLAAIAVADLVGTLISIADGAGTIVGYIESGYPGEALKALPGLIADVSSLGVPGVPGCAGLADDSIDVVYRAGGRNPGNLTPRAVDVRGLSACTTPEEALRRSPNADRVQPIRTSELKELQAVPTPDDPGHVDIRPPSQEDLDDWIRTGPDHRLTRELRAAIKDPPIMR